jgi:hypothetical protein
LLKGEFGCSVIHLRVWKKIAERKRNGIILEEDAIFSKIDPDQVDRLLYNHDSAWLGYRLNSLGYWYNCHAYAITPKTAKLLIDGFDEGIIPVDEWVPLKLKAKNNYFFDPPVVDQILRSERPSTIEGTEMLDGKNIEFKIVTVATEPEKMWALEQSAAKYGVEVVNLGKDHPWRNDMTGLGGMPKIQLINEYLSTVPDDAVILFMDAVRGRLRVQTTKTGGPHQGCRAQMALHQNIQSKRAETPHPPGDLGDDDLHSARA